MKETAGSTSDLNVRISTRVRSLRAATGLSLEALSARSDVSRSMISLIERGETSPTAVVLEKLAAALGAPLASLFDLPTKAACPVSRASERSWWKDPASGYRRRNLSPAGFPSPLQLVEVVMPGGARVAYESGPREVPVHQQIWVLEGTMEISVGDTTYQLAEDDCLGMQLNAPTAFHNPATRPARYLVALATSHRGRS
jgi:transcriptional regulator with XRE-family HTH domain